MSETIVLSCPNCATRFSAPAEKFRPDGRQVRCSHCQHMWFHAAPTVSQAEATALPLASSATVTTAGATAASATASASAAVPERSAIRDELTERHEKRGGGFLSWLLWGLVLLLLAAILAYLFRDPISRAVPSLAPHLERYTGGVDAAAQGLLGTETPPSPLQLQGIRYDLKEDENGGRFMLVEADLANTGEEERDAPQLRVRIVDTAGETLFENSVGPEDPLRTTLEPDSQTRYFTRIPEPPAEFDRVLVDVEE